LMITRIIFAVKINQNLLREKIRGVV
jgi:hypothetical protein